MLRLSNGAGVKAAIGVLCLSLFLLPLAACNTPTAPNVVKFTSINLGIPDAALKSKVTGPLPDSAQIHMRVTFKIDPRLLSQAAQQQPSQAGQPSHTQDIAKKIGISDSTYQKFKTFFNTQGISLNLSKLRTNLSIDAKASTLAKLLQTKFVMHDDSGHKFYAPQTPPKVPSFLAGSIDAITGLDNYSAPPVHTLSFASAAKAVQKKMNADCSPDQNTLLPRDVAGAYGFDQLWNKNLHGENMSVNLIEIDGSYRPDIENYSSCVAYKGQLKTFNVDGHPQEALGESTLDIQMVMGLARSATINLYQTDGSDNSADIWTNVNDMLQQVVNNNVDNASSGGVVSVSLGAAENEMSNDDVAALDSSLKQLTDIAHMTVFVASGDCAAFTDRRYGDLSVAFPASDTNVVSVGGTILQITSNRARGTEQVWSDGSNRSSCTNQWGSGGGNSQLFRQPSWQNAAGVNNKYSNGARQVPDVSAAAYALAVYFKGQWGAVGGTSAAAPIWAAGMALINQGLIQQRHNIAYSPQFFYNVANKGGSAQPYFDVTRGNNLYYPAGSGWDYASGLGTPNLAAIYEVAQSLS